MKRRSCVWTRKRKILPRTRAENAEENLVVPTLKDGSRNFILRQGKEFVAANHFLNCLKVVGCERAFENVVALRSRVKPFIMVLTVASQQDASILFGKHTFQAHEIGRLGTIS
jgi:hypothetical protein